MGPLITRRVSRRLTGLLLSAVAVSVGGCLGAKPVQTAPADQEVTAAAAAGNAALSRGAPNEAVLQYTAALRRARETDNARNISDMAYNLAAAQFRAQRYADARVTLKEAEAEAQRAGLPTADILLLEAKAARLSNDPTAAVGYTISLQNDKSAKATPGHLAQAHVLRGEMSLDDGVLDAAKKDFDSARKYQSAKEAQSPAIQAGIIGLQARIAQEEKRPAEAAPLFDRQTDLLRQAGLYRDMARSLARAGESWRGAGQRDTAADRFYWSGRSFAAQSDFTEAGVQLQAALACTDDASKGTLRERIQSLQKSLPATAAPSTQPAAGGK